MSIFSDAGNAIINVVTGGAAGGGGVQSAPSIKPQWQLVKDSAGTIWLTKAGVPVPYGIRSIPVPGQEGIPYGPALSRGLAALGATGRQTQGIQQAVDSGAIMQGGNKVGAPLGQQPGTTLPKFGQKSSGSEATADFNVAGPFNAIGNAISSTADFLKLIAWIFHPRNILRGVEFLTGIVLIIFGFWAALQARGERGEGFQTGESALSRSGLGRVSRELAAATGSRRRPSRPATAPHRTRRTALRTRYEREQQVSRRKTQQRRGQ